MALDTKKKKRKKDEPADEAPVKETKGKPAKEPKAEKPKKSSKKHKEADESGEKRTKGLNFGRRPKKTKEPNLDAGSVDADDLPLTAAVDLEDKVEDKKVTTESAKEVRQLPAFSTGLVHASFSSNLRILNRDSKALELFVSLLNQKEAAFALASVTAKNSFITRSKKGAIM